MNPRSIRNIYKRTGGLAATGTCSANPFCVAILTLGFLFYAVQESNSQIIDWASAGNGTFSDGSNWTGGDPPQTTQTARFNTGANPQYTVSFTGNAETRAAIVIGGSDVHWNLGTNTYNLNQDQDLNGLIVGQDGSGSLTITNGHVVQTNSQIFAIGDGTAQSKGTLTLSGSGTSFTATAGTTTGFSIIGNATASEANESLLRLESGASFSANRLRVANSGGHRGAVEISGAGSQLNTGHSVQIGQFGHGRLVVENGGSWVQTGSGTIISAATTQDGSGRLRVDAGSVTLRNLTFGEKGIFDAVLHTNGFAPLVSFDGNGRTLNLTDGINGTASMELSLAPGFTANLGDVFTLFQHSGTNFSINGQFLYDGDLIGHGSKIFVGAYQFEVGITTGTGGSYTLTTIPEPGTVGLLLLSGAALLALRSRRTS